MIEAFIVLLFIFAGGWLVLATIGFFLKLMFWLIAGVFGLVGGAMLMMIMVPLSLVLGLIVLPIVLLSMLPFMLPFLLFAGLVWLLLRNRPRRAILR